MSAFNEAAITRVSGLYGPGALTAWIFTVSSVIVSWTFNLDHRTKDTITIDFLAMLTLPAVAAGDIFMSRARETDYAAPSHICEAFSNLGFAFLALALLLGLKARAALVGIVLCLCRILDQPDSSLFWRILYYLASLYTLAVVTWAGHAFRREASGTWTDITRVIILYSCGLSLIVFQHAAQLGVALTLVLPATVESDIGFGELDQAVAAIAGLSAFVYSFWEARKSREESSDDAHSEIAD